MELPHKHSNHCGHIDLGQLLPHAVPPKVARASLDMCSDYCCLLFAHVTQTAQSLAELHVASVLLSSFSNCFGPEQQMDAAADKSYSMQQHHLCVT